MAIYKLYTYKIICDSCKKEESLHSEQDNPCFMKLPKNWHRVGSKTGWQYYCEDCNNIKDILE